VTRLKAGYRGKWNIKNTRKFFVFALLRFGSVRRTTKTNRVWWNPRSYLDDKDDIIMALQDEVGTASNKTAVDKTTAVDETTAVDKTTLWTKTTVVKTRQLL
jgi:hypothetical protein